MKKVLFGVLAGALAFNAFAADLMSKEEFAKVKDQYVKVGSVTTANEVSISDAKEELSKKADEKGGDIYVVTSNHTENKIHGTADVYKKK
ncbi:MAG TPA: DUF1471 family periplasmic protein YahO [Buttiauxella sp.]|jgi:hypothetical protein